MKGKMLKERLRNEAQRPASVVVWRALLQKLSEAAPPPSTVSTPQPTS